MQANELLRTDARGIAERVMQWRYGVIEARQGQVTRIAGRWVPKWISLAGVWWAQQVIHRHREGDRCWLYYDQPLFHSNFLTLKFMQSCRGTSVATVTAALEMLDRVAELKGCDAILCEVKNPRLTSRVMERYGWTRHLEDASQRHYIRRFYGQYPRK